MLKAPLELRKANHLIRLWLQFEYRMVIAAADIRAFDAPSECLGLAKQSALRPLQRARKVLRAEGEAWDALVYKYYTQKTLDRLVSRVYDRARRDYTGS